LRFTTTGRHASYANKIRENVILKFFIDKTENTLEYKNEGKMKKNIFYILLIFIGSFTLFSCYIEIEGKGFHFDEETFIKEWNAWKNENILNYSFTMAGKLPYWYFPRDIPMYGYKVKIIVRNGVMYSFEYIGDVPYLDGESSVLEPEFTSISDIYQKISNRAEEEKEWWEKRPDEAGIISTSFEVRYDPQLHYITFFEPTSKWESEWIVDTTAHSITISDFTVSDNNSLY
jgi:hypothetical protein